MTTITLPVTISRARLDRLHALRQRAGLERVPDAVLVQILVNAGLAAEEEDCERLAEVKP